MKSLTFYSIIATVLLNFPILKAQAQQPIPLELSWEKGTVVLTIGDTVRGSVILTTPRDMLRVITETNEARFFAPADVSSFEVSGMHNKNRLTNKSGAKKMGFDFQYRTFPWNLDRDYGNFISPGFFIMLKPGNYSLLMRLVKEAEGPISPGGLIGSAAAGGIGGYGGRMLSEQILEEKLYLCLPENKVIALRSPKKDLKRVFTKSFGQIENYAESNKLRFNNPADLALIISFANTLNP